MGTKPNILFLCTGNSCRSQMAEGWAKKFHPETLNAYSAGTDPHGMNVRAVRVMDEVGVSLSDHSSKHIDTLADVSFDLVVTVCDSAKELCPVYPGNTEVIHRSFEDPPRLAQESESEEEALTHFRRVRDEIRDFVRDLNSLTAAAF